MIEAHRQLISRLFGPGSVLAGTGGTVDKPGELRIHVDGVLCGRGPTLGAAIAAAQSALSVVARLRAA